MLRALVAAGPILALACARAAGSEPIVAIDLAIVGLTLICVAFPDSHFGLLVVLAIGVDWMITVDDPTTPWSIGVAISLALFHASMAAASIGPLGAAWTPAMRSRWGRRFATLAIFSLPSWALVALIDRFEIDGSPALLLAALLALAVGALWARHGRLDVNSLS